MNKLFCSSLGNIERNPESPADVTRTPADGGGGGEWGHRREQAG